MSLLRPSHVVAIAVPMVCVFAACSGARHEGGSTSGEGGSSEAVGESATTGSGGNEAADAAVFDAATYCPGDETSWGKLTAEPFACQTSADCCVIVSACLAQSQIVAAMLQAEATAAWPYCDVDCVDCIPPAIEVGCTAGTCRGRVVVDAPPDSPLRLDHCGDPAKAVDLSGSTGLHFGCGS